MEAIASGEGGLPRCFASPAESVESVKTELCSQLDEIKDSYRDLVKDGGRPFFPFHLIDEIGQDPLAHWDMLRPWLFCAPGFMPSPSSEPRWNVFSQQRKSWTYFRNWQEYNRQEGPPRPVAKCWQNMSFVPVFNLFVQDFRSAYPTYTEAAEKLLAQYEFTRPFQFLQDAAKQDQLTTWIEYLCYEFSVEYWYDDVIKRGRPVYNKAWKTLVDSGVLEPFETEEIICGTAMSLVCRQREWDEGLQNLRSAEAALEELLPDAEIRAQMVAVRGAARESFESFTARYEALHQFFRETNTYRGHIERAVMHHFRLKWLLDQVPLIEAELNGSSETDTSSGAVCDVEASKRGENNELPHCQGIEKSGPSADGASPTSGLRAASNLQGERAENGGDSITGLGMASPETKGGDQGSGPGLSIPDTAAVGSSGSVSGPDGAEHAAANAAGGSSPASPQAGNPRVRKRNIDRAAQSSKAAVPFRRSARIAARQAGSRAEAASEVAAAPPVSEDRPRKKRRGVTGAS